MRGGERQLLGHILAALSTACLPTGPTVGRDTGACATAFDTCPTAPVVRAADADRILAYPGESWLVCREPPEGQPCPCNPRLDDEVEDILGYPDPCWAWGWIAEVSCGPDPAIEDTCCYVTTISPDEQYCGDGRPFTVHRAHRRAPVQAAPAPSALVSAWTHIGRNEHAAVASFARLALQLLALGAPPALVQAAQRAAADEVHHAQLCFGIASTLGGSPVRPGPLDLHNAFPAPTLAHVLTDTIREGCITETLSAATAHAMHRACRVPAIQAALQRIATDETRHAAFAWRLVRWGLTVDPTLRPLVRDTFQEALARVDPIIPDPPSAHRLQPYGILPPSVRHAVRQHARSHLIPTCRDALLR